MDKNIEVTVNWPNEPFTLDELTQTTGTSKVILRARLNKSLKQGTLQITGRKKTNPGRGRPSFVYSKLNN